jgi:enoyl-CoA hydratase
MSYGSYSTLLVEQTDAVLKVTVNRPEVLNAQGRIMREEFDEALAIAADDAKFADRTVRWGGSHVQYASLPWEIGFRKAKEYLFTGDWITAEEALHLGLVNRVVPREKLTEETLALAQRIALQDPFALRLAKASLNLMQDEMGFRTAIHSAYQTYAVSVAYRREQGSEGGGVERARRRYARFGDHH